MSRPASTTSTRNLPGNGETAQVAVATPRALMREAASVARLYGLELTPAQIRRVVTGYLTDPESPDTVEAYFLDYLDPTGERATSNVMRQPRAS